MLCPSEERAHRRRIEVERDGELLVGLAFAPEQQDRGIAPAKTGEDGANALTVVLCRPEVFRRRRRRPECGEQAFVPGASCLTAELIEPHPHRRPIQPSGDVFAAYLRMPAPLQEDIDGNLLRASAVDDDPADDAGYPTVRGGERVLEIRVPGGSGLAPNRVLSLHTYITPGGAGL